MRLEEMRPFVRFVRRLDLTGEALWGKAIPRDYRLFYAQRGTGTIWTEQGEFRLEPGSMLLIPAGCVYWLLPSRVTYLAVNFDYTWNHSSLNFPVPPLFLQKGDQGSVLETVQFQDAPELNGCLYGSGLFSLETQLRSLLETYAGKALFGAVSASAILTEIIVSLLRQGRTEAETPGRLNLNAVMAYVQAHFAEKITNRELGELFHFHPTYLSDAFRKTYGKSLHQYVMERRILEGITLLEEGRKSVEEVARAVGFCDSSYFCRYFKKMTGVSPKQYQR